MRLSGKDRDLWSGLTEARDTVARMCDEGIVSEEVLGLVNGRFARLELLLRADVASLRLGGRKSDRLRAEIESFRDLLVELIDAAVEHQSALLDSVDIAPIVLAELTEWLRSHTQARRELGGD